MLILNLLMCLIGGWGERRVGLGDGGAGCLGSCLDKTNLSCVCFHHDCLASYEAVWLLGQIHGCFFLCCGMRMGWCGGRIEGTIPNCWQAEIQNEFICITIGG